MRFFFSGPKFFGIRPGVSFGASDFAKTARTQRGPSEPITGSFVYALRGDHNLVKVGITTNPRARLASLRTGSAFPIDYAYLAVTPGDCGAAIERTAHKMLHSHRCNGEWFDVPAEMAVAAIAAAAHQLGHPLLPVTTEISDDIVRIASGGGEAYVPRRRLQDSPLFVLSCGLIAGTLAFIWTWNAFSH